LKSPVVLSRISRYWYGTLVVVPVIVTEGQSVVFQSKSEADAPFVLRRTVYTKGINASANNIFDI
jgi:hypothetical protein